jgi:hypothetical protein
MLGGCEGAACVSHRNGREALGAPRDRRAAAKELDGASDILSQKYLRASKDGAGKELSFLDCHHKHKAFLIRHAHLFLIPNTDIQETIAITERGGGTLLT